MSMRLIALLKYDTHVDWDRLSAAIYAANEFYNKPAGKNYLGFFRIIL